MTVLGVFVGHESAKVREFESWLGRPVEAVHGFTGGQTWETPDPGWQIGMQEYLGGAGRPIIWSIPMTPDDGGAAAMREAATGARNYLYTGWAQKILASRQGDSDPIYVRTTWELGGEWFPWTQAAKDDPAAYRGAFQQFAKAFHDVSDRFQMVWDFNSDRGPVEQWYPGDEAVDVIAQDIYWTAEYQGDDPVEAFDKSVNGYSRGLAWMTEFAAQHGKPMAIPEWGVPGNAGDTHDGAKWISLMENWIETHNVVYASYWNDVEGSGYVGKLSDNDPYASAARLKQLFAEGFDDSTGSTPTNPTQPSYPTPVVGTAGSGSDNLVLKISQDAYQGPAQYTVSVDGKQVGGTFTASASHASGQSDTLTLRGNWAAGTHQVSIKFVNDLYGGSQQADRNLYLDGATYNGQPVSGASLAILGGDPAGFGFTEAAAPGGSTTATIGTGSDALVLKVSQDAYQGSAQYTVSVDGKQVGGTLTAVALHGGGQSDTVTVRGDWAPGGHTVSVTFLNDAWGGSAATDRNLYVDGATYNGAAVSGAAKTLLSAGPASFSFTEASAANLTLQGTAGADVLTGGAGNDRLLGLAGNDTLTGGAGGDALNGGAGADRIDAGAGDDYLLGGAGADVLVGGAGQDRFAFLAVGEGGDTVTDFKAAEGDRLDFRGVFGGTGQKYAELSAKGFVKAAAVSGGVLVSVDADGGGNGYVSMATLQGLTVASLGTDFLIA